MKVTEAGVVRAGSDRSPESREGGCVGGGRDAAANLPKFERLATPFAGPEVPPYQLEWPV